MASCGEKIRRKDLALTNLSTGAIFALKKYGLGGSTEHRPNDN